MRNKRNEEAHIFPAMRGTRVTRVGEYPNRAFEREELEYTLKVTIRPEQIAKQLGYKALNNVSRKSKYLGGAVEVEVIQEKSQ